MVAGQSSTTHGYFSGGGDPARRDVIEKFPFASDDNSTDVGDLTAVNDSLSGQSSTTHGYASGGYNGPPGASDTIEKFPFSTDANATDVGDLTLSRYQLAGQQY